MGTQRTYTEAEMIAMRRSLEDARRTVWCLVMMMGGSARIDINMARSWNGHSSTMSTTMLPNQLGILIKAE